MFISYQMKNQNSFDRVCEFYKKMPDQKESMFQKFSFNLMEKSNIFENKDYEMIKKNVTESQERNLPEFYETILFENDRKIR